jgi:hypothetical protein
VRRLVNNSAVRGDWVLVMSSATWRQVEAFRREIRVWCREVRVYQEGYGPSDEQTDFCSRHQFYYGGCLGCHVCSGFYEE